MIKRILFSIFALLVVVMVVMALVYTLTNRSVIFQTDDLWNKKSGNDRAVYEYNQYQNFGYLSFENYSAYVAAKYKERFGEEYNDTVEFAEARNAIRKPETYLEHPDVQEFIELYKSKGYEIKYLAPEYYKRGGLVNGMTPYLLAIKENNPMMRLVYYVRDFLSFETVNDVKDENLTERYIRFEKDPYSGLFAVVGSGTTHRYLLYFDSRFPFIHQNFVHINLGTSYTKYRGQEITTVITAPVGEPKITEQQYPAWIGTDKTEMTATDFHTARYNPATTEEQYALYGSNYTTVSMHKTELSMLETSFIIGIFSTIISYFVGLPLGILMARNKDRFFDNLGNIYIIFIMAVPSLAYIFMFAAFMTRTFGLPYKFANAVPMILGFILPTLSISLKEIGGFMKWMRRYMIDQSNSDYVKFARAEGLSEREIYAKHISRNALIFIVHGIPGSILGCLVGAIITERVYAVPGVGNLLTNAINSHDNGIIIACTVFYTALSILSVILGDLLLAKYDPRISLSSERGGGR